jgi:ATP-dependent helicase/nuclease subunit A
MAEPAATRGRGEMSKPVRQLEPLKDDQASGAAPDVHAWVAASAGTGKTQVLSARVLRLLLQGTPPHAILCLTFTKLAAAEMQNRVFDRLGLWARCDEEALKSDLRALRAGDDDVMVARARQLFARVLDAPQGMAVQTIHAFSQGLIASFPVEAGVSPGFQTLDDRSAAALRRRLLAEAIERAADAEDSSFLDDLAMISIAGGETRLGQIAARLGSHGEALAGLSLAGIEPMLRHGFGLAADRDAAGALAAAMEGVDGPALERLACAMEQGGKIAAEKLPLLRGWLAFGVTERVAGFDQLCAAILAKSTGAPDSRLVTKAVAAFDPAAPGLLAAIGALLMAARAEQRLYAAAAHAACHLRIGLRLAADFTRAKARLGAVDYDDMIAAAQRLLQADGAADWVRYKLDQRIEHILVDEAQDTNLRQWQIIDAMAAEFWSGEGARAGQRTLFVVGDFKQAIFSFQGSDPRIYADQKDSFAQLAADGGELWRDIALATNFRSVPAVLTVVDAVADELGHATLDRSGVVPPHLPHRSAAAGAVTLWPPLLPETDGGGESDGDDGDDADDDDTGGAARAPRAEVQLAHRIAATIAGWLDPRAPLLRPALGTPVRPQDILVLVRRRSAFSGALVAALHDAGVPVAGVDRLKLAEPLAVADLLALVRFALQPADDLTLAALLVSPFCGLDHDALFALADRRPGSLWERVLASDVPAVGKARAWLLEMLGFADFAAPYEGLERILSGPLQGRALLLARLGSEARDAIDTMLDQALAFEAIGAPTLQGFLAWIEADDIEIKRDPDAPLDAVRLMTVHGAKGLQAPVVILADATRKRQPERQAPLLMEFPGAIALPVFLGSRKGLSGPLQEAIDAQEDFAEREHCRLLYVALTRAEDLLFIGGALGAGQTLAPEDSWYATVARALETLDADAIEAAGWPGETLEFRTGTPAPPQLLAVLTPAPAASPPEWLHRPPAAEARPPRPLSPSAIAADDVAGPPIGPAAAAAARRGAALHALFERLPGIEPQRRRAIGEAWLGSGWPDLDAPALVDRVLAILDDPRFAAVFAPEALAEAPMAAVVGGNVIAGTVDRLLVTETSVTVVDFKTGRRVPASADAVEPYHLRQMAAYVAALEVVFPGRHIRAALLYTEGPALIELPDAIIGLHRPQADLLLNAGAPTPIFPS